MENVTLRDHENETISVFLEHEKTSVLNSFWLCIKSFWIRGENIVCVQLKQKQEGKCPSENLCVRRAWGQMHKLDTTTNRQIRDKTVKTVGWLKVGTT